MPATDAVLMQRWDQSRDAEAFRELVNRYAGMVFSTARRILGNAADAEDVTQECFLRLLQRHRGAKNVAAWLHRVATHCAIDVLRRHSTRRAAEKRWEASATAGNALAWQDIEPHLDEAIEALPEGLRVPLVEYYLRSQTQEAIAESLGVHQSTVSDRVRKGVETIRERLERRGLGLALAPLCQWLSTDTTEAAPPTVLTRLGKVAILGHGADRAGQARTLAKTDVASTSALDGWPVKITVASFVGLVVVGSLALIVFNRPRPSQVAPLDLAAAPPGLPELESTAEASQPPPETALPDATPPAPPGPKPATLSGTLRNENGEPVAAADVYLAMTPPVDEDFFGRLGSYYRPDYFKRSSFLATRTDSGGHYAFEDLREFGAARLGAFKENHSGPGRVGTRGIATVAIEEGATLANYDLVLAEGKTLTGKLVALDGSPVADAVVSVTTAWTATDHIFWPAGLAPTDEDGQFRLGLEERAAGCHLRVNSESHGQGFFIEVPVTDDAAELTLRELALVEGTITWTDGTPASGLTVRVNGRLPEPPIPIDRTGVRPYVVHDGLVEEDGTYIIEGLHPQLDYAIFVMDSSLGEQEARKNPLTPRMRTIFRLDAGEVKVWNHAVSSPITIRGRIRTETTGTPLAEGEIAVHKDGRRLALSRGWADADGFFEIRLREGPGEYRVHAEPPVGFSASDEVGKLIDTRFGKTLHVSGTEDVEVDLKIFEPATFPLRVLDNAGEPLKNVQVEFHVTFPNGQTVTHDAPHVLDDTGRKSFVLYHPATEFWYEVSAHRGGPTQETRRYKCSPGAVLPEETIVLPPTCDVEASILEPSGAPHKERWVRLRVTYEDGSKGSFTPQTDKAGALQFEGRVRAAPFVLELRSADSRWTWTSPRLDGTAQGVLHLGEIVLVEGEDN